MNESSLSRLLDDLPQVASDQARADRVRSRCHTMLARQRSRAVRQTMGPGLRQWAIAGRRASPWRWEPLVVGMGCLYFAGVIREALQVYGRW